MLVIEMVSGFSAEMAEEGIARVALVEALEDQAPDQDQRSEEPLVAASRRVGSVGEVLDEGGGQHLLKDGQELLYTGCGLRLRGGDHVILLARDRITVTLLSRRSHQTTL